MYKTCVRLSICRIWHLILISCQVCGGVAVKELCVCVCFVFRAFISSLMPTSQAWSELMSCPMHSELQVKLHSRDHGTRGSTRHLKTLKTNRSLNIFTPDLTPTLRLCRHVFTGFPLNDQLFQLIIRRYSDESGNMDFDNYIGCLVRLDAMCRECVLALANAEDQGDVWVCFDSYKC